VRCGAVCVVFVMCTDVSYLLEMRLEVRAWECRSGAEVHAVHYSAVNMQIWWRAERRVGCGEYLLQRYIRTSKCAFFR
jgi:hypothetical protein